MPADIGTLGQQMPRQEDDLLRRVKALEQQLQQTQSSAAGSGALASELLSRSTTAVSNFGFSNTFTSNLSTTDTGASMTLTLDKARRLVFLTTISFFMTVAAGTGSRYVQGYHGVLQDGVTKASVDTSLAPNGTVGYSFADGRTLTGMHAFNVPAGTHTFSTFVQGFITGTGMQGQFTAPTLTVIVLQAV